LDFHISHGESRRDRIRLPCTARVLCQRILAMDFPSSQLELGPQLFKIRINFKSKRVILASSILNWMNSLCTDGSDGTTPGQYSERVLKDASSNDENRNSTIHVNTPVLDPSEPRTLWISGLGVKIRLFETINWDKWGPIHRMHFVRSTLLRFE